MCGIAGLITTDPAERIRRALDAIAHRGRDDEGVWTTAATDEEGRRVCLGHRRLSIIDTSAAGHQPFVSQDGRYVLTYNGELYNFR
jgi:asparagine synthase (glutamine-hydrolysing)